MIFSIESEMNAEMYTCPCCGYKTLENEPPGTYDICPICFWEDDPIQYEERYYAGGANRFSLVEAQKNFKKFGACDGNALAYVRKPNKYDVIDPNWQPYPIHESVRNEEIVIDLSHVKSIKELHKVLKQDLCFPEFYGMNWDAFWDAITGLMTMPRRLIIKGWINIEQNFPKIQEL